MQFVRSSLSVQTRVKKSEDLDRSSDFFLVCKQDFGDSSDQKYRFCIE